MSYVYDKSQWAVITPKRLLCFCLNKFDFRAQISMVDSRPPTKVRMFPSPLKNIYSSPHFAFSHYLVQRFVPDTAVQIPDNHIREFLF